MSILSSTTVTTPFIPHWLRGQEGAPVYHIRAVDVIERERFESELAGDYRAGRVWPYETTQVLIDAFKALGGGDAPYLITLVQRESAAKFLNGDALTAPEQAELDAARRIAIEHWPEYAELVAQMQRREHMLPIVAFCKYCLGWDSLTDKDGNPVPFARDELRGVVDNASLRKVPPLQMKAAGSEIYRLMYLDEDDVKNSEAPSGSSDSPPTSDSGAESPEDGKSDLTGGTKTPPSSSPAISASSSEPG